VRHDSLIRRVSKKGAWLARTGRRFRKHIYGTEFAHPLETTRVSAVVAGKKDPRFGHEGVMSLVRLLGFNTLTCGCVVGRYREVATSREISYVEEKGKACGSHGHRRNHTVSGERLSAAAPIALASKAS
jgi:hypothetical protein